MEFLLIVLCPSLMILGRSATSISRDQEARKGKGGNYKNGRATRSRILHGGDAPHVYSKAGTT